MVKAGLGLIRESGKIFLEAAPSGIDPPALGARLTGVAGVVELHDLHVWQITSGEPALSAHVLVAEELDCHAIRGEIESLLRADYRITHSTLQVDHADLDVHCEDAHGASYRPDAIVNSAHLRRRSDGRSAAPHLDDEDAGDGRRRARRRLPFAPGLDD
jgi:cobalt-zinc-cadmium efflux system protein